MKIKLKNEIINLKKEIIELKNTNNNIWFKKKK